MKHLFLVLTWAFSLSACTDSNPEYRQPSNINGSADGATNATDGQSGAVGDGDIASMDGQVITMGDAQVVPTDGPILSVDSQTSPADGGPARSDVSTPDMGSSADGGSQADGGLPVDGDDDGVTSDLDCDDGNRSIFPGAPEVCDGLDNNCDRLIDELWPSLEQPCTVGVGACQGAGVLQCSPNQNDVACNADVGQPRAEACDQIDNDCDGTADEAVENCCIPGEDRPCGSDVGECRPGTQVCDGNGRYGNCQQARRAREEVCNGLDDDCDGSADEDLSRVCGSNTGACETGVQLCANGNFGVCIGMVDAAVEVCDTVDNDCDGQTDEGLINACGRCGDLPDEICDGLDNNCDGIVDEGCECAPGNTEECGSSVGGCLPGERRCMGGIWGDCVGAIGPADEQCDSVDNDCDGNTDELIVLACGSDVGTCSQGTKVCAAGRFGDCLGGVRPSDERCDNMDNDCDGRNDEDVTRSCGNDVGQCIAGIERCDAGQFGICVGALNANPEECDDLDNDCDGTTDEDLTRSCGTDVGECTTGIQACVNGDFEECDGGQRPVAELCDELDNDCDGQADENLPNGCADCDPGRDEVCNGLDDDCDGQVDEVDSLCIIYAGFVRGPVANFGVGQDLIIVGDLNEDGVEEALASGRNQGQGVIVAVDGMAQENLWHHVDEGPLGASLAVINANDRENVAIFAGAPRDPDGAIHRYDANGDEIDVYVGDEDFKLGETLASHPDLPGLVIGYSGFNEERGSFLISIGEGSPFVSGLAPGQQLGEKAFIIPDVDGDLIPDIVSTVRFGEGFLAGRGTQYFPSTNWLQRSDTLSPFIPQTTFAESIVWGNFLDPNSYFFAFGTPGVDSIGRENIGGVYPVNLEGAFMGTAMTGNVIGGGMGRRMATYRRPGENLDWLIIGGSAAGKVEFWRLRNTIAGPGIAERVPATIGNADASFGRSMAITQPTADGRSILYVGEPGGNRGRIHLFWIR